LNTDYIERLRKAIRDLHGCESTHVGTTAVKETFQGKTIWEGPVETFLLTGHSSAQRCYAWAQASGKDEVEKTYIAVLGIPPINSPGDAVRSVIFADSHRT
jgi:hypothetical protein